MQPWTALCWHATTARMHIPMAVSLLCCRYQLRVCVEACKHRLLTIENRSISWNTALAMLHLPPGLREGDAFAALTEVRAAAVSPDANDIHP
jgi:hypothetical protein